MRMGSWGSRRAAPEAEGTGRLLGPPPREPGSALPAWEVAFLVAAFAAVAVLRVAALSRQPYDSDEWQHLHVAWAYSQGEAPYRDVFDNHMPLFHLLAAPFVAAVGERTDIVDLARWLMLPVFAATLWATYSIGRVAFGRRVGLWAAALIGLHSDFFHRSIEFRTDDLWALVWLLTLRALALARVGGAWSSRRGFAAGLLLGATFAVSLKTALPAVSLGAAALALAAVFPDARRGPSLRRGAAVAAAVAGGALVVPGAIAVWMAFLGALPEFAYCTLGHSTGDLGAVDGPWSRAWGPAVTLAALAVPVAGAAILARARGLPGDRTRQLLLLLTAGIHGVLLFTAWPGNMPQDNLPYFPMAALAVSALLLWAAPRWRDVFVRASSPPSPAAPRAHRVAGIAVAALVLFGGLRIALRPPVRAGRSFDERGFLADVLKLTDRSDFVLDTKGEAVFRDRPFRYVLEKFTRRKIADGTIRDTIPERCVETRTCVTLPSPSSFPPRAREFLERAYVRVGRVRVAGVVLGAPPDPDGALAFELAIPVEYAIVSERGRVAGSLDGSAYSGPRFLAAGRHAFRPAAPPPARLAVVWARAVERGYTPFAADAEDVP